MMTKLLYKKEEELKKYPQEHNVIIYDTVQCIVLLKVLLLLLL